MDHQKQPGGGSALQAIKSVHHFSELHDLAYHEWKVNGHHLEEYGSEFLGTALLVMAVVGAVTVVQAAGSPIAALIKPMPLRLLLTGFLIATSGMLITISPFGRLSGAHLNPAVSFGFWQMGKLQARDLAGYVLSQMVGALTGAEIAKLSFGRLAHEVGYAAMEPGAHDTVIIAFVGETVCTFVMTIAIFYFVSHQPLARWTPFMLMLLIPFLVLADATISGCGMNPARWYGPAYVAHLWIAAWIYIVGPVIGAALAVFVRRSGIAKSPIPITAKLFHDPKYRSLFHHDRLPTHPHSGEPA